MKRPLTRGEKLLFASPILLVLVGVTTSMWKKSRPVTFEIPDAFNIGAINYSPDGKRLAVFYGTSADGANGGLIYDNESHRTVCVLQAPPIKRQLHIDRHYEWPSWSPDGTRLVTTYQDIWQKPAPLAKSPLLSATSTPTSYYLDSILVWDAQSGVITGDYSSGIPRRPLSGIRSVWNGNDLGTGWVRFSPDGKNLIGEKPVPSLFDATTGQPLRRWKGTFPTTSKGRINQRLGLLAIADRNEKQLQVFDTKTRRVLWQPETKEVYDFRWHGDVLALSIVDAFGKGRVLLWDGKARKPLAAAPLPFGYTPTELDFCPTSNVLVFYSSDEYITSEGDLASKGELVAWDYRQNRVLWRYATLFPMWNIQYSPDGKWLAAIGSKSVHDDWYLLVFNRDGKLSLERRTDTDQMAWSPNSRHIATAVDKKSESAWVEIIDVGE